MCDEFCKYLIEFEIGLHRSQIHHRVFPAQRLLPSSHQLPVWMHKKNEIYWWKKETQYWLTISFPKSPMTNLKEIQLGSKKTRQTRGILWLTNKWRFDSCSGLADEFKIFEESSSDWFEKMRLKTTMLFAFFIRFGLAEKKTTCKRRK